eukprot:9487630-Pyramimonas_sp.AAC.1
MKAPACHPLGPDLLYSRPDLHILAGISGGPRSPRRPSEVTDTSVFTCVRTRFKRTATLIVYFQHT